jgi:uncharacterized protein (TIGR03435 family)
MQTILRKLTLGLAVSAALIFAQSKPSFEVATIKPSAPLDQAKIVAALQSGGKMPIGMHLSPGQAEYTYLDLRTLVSLAYGVKPNQVTGPDWMASTRFDITAKMPGGATKDDANKMLQSLLEERFKLVAHRSTAEHPVLAIVQGKGPLKLKESAEKPVAIDENTPLRPGEMKMDGQDGPIRMSVNAANGTAVVDMGLKGKMTQKLNPATQSVHMDFSMTTLPGFAEMLTQMMSQMAGGATRPIVDMTDIKGNYDVSIEFPIAEILAIARNAGMDLGAVPGGRGPGAGPADAASDPSGGASSLTDAVQALGLKLESRKAMVEQIVVDKIEKTPTDN